LITISLGFIDDIDLREMIQAATCKSEAFNNFIQWVFFKFVKESKAALLIR